MKYTIADALESDVSYDVECYMNIFTLTAVHLVTGTRWIFEISDWVNDSQALHDWIRRCEHYKMRMVGFNNEHYDYPMLHTFMTLFAGQGYVTATQLYAKSQSIFENAKNDKTKFNHVIWPRDRFVTQLDLFKVHHFDNKAKTTNLKALEVNMRSFNVEDLPFDPKLPISAAQRPILIKYNAHDVNETGKFYLNSLDMIKFRDTLSAKHGVDFTNYNDTKIGKEFFIMRLEEAQPGICYTRIGRKKQANQTPRKSIPLAPLIFPYVNFEHPEFQRVLNYLRTVTITNTKSAPEMENLSAVINGFSFDFGTGGIHGSMTKSIVRSDDEYEVVDADVTSFYPMLAIANGVFPEHLSELFCRIYKDLFDERALYPKTAPESAMIKLALNGVYGDSNNEHGPFLDPAYTMTITINGQLSLCMFAEQVIAKAGAQMIQANTDGITVRIPRKNRHIYDELAKQWEARTRLQLEFADYDGMWIRDVNSYLARTTKGKIKRVGAYQYIRPDEVPEGAKPELGWHQDHSALIVPKAAEAVMLEGRDLREFIYSHPDAFDFMNRVKVPRSSKLMLTTYTGEREAMFDENGKRAGYRDVIGHEEQTQNIARYFIANEGPSLVKVMPPLAKNPEKERRIGVNTGWSVGLCNSLDDWDWSKLNREFYVQEAQKLVLT